MPVIRPTRGLAARSDFLDVYGAAEPRLTTGGKVDANNNMVLVTARLRCVICGYVSCFCVAVICGRCSLAS